MPEITYKKFDVHAHVEGPKDTYVEVLDSLDIAAVLNISYGGFLEPGGVLAYEKRLREDTGDYPGRFLYCASFSIRPFNAPGFAEDAIAKLRRDIQEHGAVAVKIWKDLGTMLRDEEGKCVFCDDSRFAPVFDFVAAQGLPLLMHQGDPKSAWRPLDPASPHYGYYKDHPEELMYGRDDVPSHEELMAHRDNLVQRYPEMTFIACHLASLAHDLSEIARFLERFPNACVDTAGRVGDLQGHPNEQVRDFLIRCADRVLYGVDWEVDERTFPSDPAGRRERVDRARKSYLGHFSYFEETLALPPPVLEKLYWANAARIFRLP